MTDTVTIAVKLDSHYTIKTDGQTATFTLKLDNVPPEVIQRIQERADEVGAGMYQAVFDVLGGKLVHSEKHWSRTSIDGVELNNKVVN